MLPQKYQTTIDQANQFIEEMKRKNNGELTTNQARWIEMVNYLARLLENKIEALENDGDVQKANSKIDAQFTRFNEQSMPGKVYRNLQQLNIQIDQDYLAIHTKQKIVQDIELSTSQDPITTPQSDVKEEVLNSVDLTQSKEKLTEVEITVEDKVEVVKDQVETEIKEKEEKIEEKIEWTPEKLAQRINELGDSDFDLIMKNAMTQGSKEFQGWGIHDKTVGQLTWFNDHKKRTQAGESLLANLNNHIDKVDDVIKISGREAFKALDTREDEGKGDLIYGHWETNQPGILYNTYASLNTCIVRNVCELIAGEPISEQDALATYDLIHLRQPKLEEKAEVSSSLNSPTHFLDEGLKQVDKTPERVLEQ
ncbi:MAG: hypothetical protein EP298_10430 [Gammaproteobacteria bacterium]|nr:MAG: hypothetical protein EP298_10430 [Gammaproteobacteria bacterium]UTW42188.1 hypothetical protein KFE69_11950 [bacterium SCSIO 12844]